ncbi:flavin reductase family protein [Aurantibacillus circumpalustris]|uniref:flavin reductase family protein n=1 Tax=Aurantibacillus circumpalustris TaxID=3036359 RepID=UPI00295ADC2A|nr:iron-sulfur cluster-binding domain-containing protein [Aurantibacillus circumpalustris]
MANDTLIKKIKISAIIQETEHAKTFVFECLNGWKPLYKPGQFITLIFYTMTGEKRRSYSISSTPSLNGELRITVKKVDNGEFSRYMLSHLMVGDVLSTSGISGLFILPESISLTNHFCFIAAGSGIVPCFSLIKTILATTSNEVTLIYSNKNKEETIFYEALQTLLEKHATRFKTRFLFSDNNDLYNKRLSKWLLEQLLQEYLGRNIENALFYLSGPHDYMQTVEITLRIQVPKEKIIKENFSSFPRLILPEPPDKNSHHVKIHLNEKVHTIRVQYPKSILAAAKEQNIELPYSCEAGRCSSCVATCTKGKVWMAYNEVLVEKEIEKGRILVCQSFPIDGDAEIVYDIN